MARPRKARVEGAQSFEPVMIRADNIADLSDWTPVDHGAFETILPDPVPGDNGEALARIVSFFQASFPDEWEGLKLCPLKHGLETMIERLKA